MYVCYVMLCYVMLCMEWNGMEWNGLASFFVGQNQPSVGP